MIAYNICFNILLSTLSMCGLIRHNPLFYLQLLKSSTIFYFFTDAIMEVKLYSRYSYIPHHIISIVSCLSLNENSPYDYVFVTFFLAESSSLSANIRYVLKTKEKLHIEMDTILYMYFFFCRIIGLPYVIYNLKNELILYYGGICIYLMSLYWSFKWMKSITKKRTNRISN